MKSKRRKFYVPHKRRNRFDLRAILKNNPVKQGAIVTFLFTLQATLIACSSNGSVTVECFIDPDQEGCDTVAESISRSVPGGAAIADESPRDILDMCSEIRNPAASIDREQLTWITTYDNGSLTLAQLFEAVGQPLCKADYGVTVHLGNEGKDVYAPVYIYPLEFAVSDPVEYAEVVVSPENGTPLGVPGIGVVSQRSDQ
ncbi:hypothetical protein H6G00_05075 [Leptolyngbya sp. FACHB-541]|uniref:hypothetical protein n=1 Tax=Leptolyngbya sp. FACHB-541 TaxID=2692810 RepID=UPI001682448D|nr:hypothetical protein [Leptolyngbya sp. FACHB-541]MBD1995988.1 hypothetical protein [Leptolyngbya sp. FACHB-541]